MPGQRRDLPDDGWYEWFPDFFLSSANAIGSLIAGPAQPSWDSEKLMLYWGSEVIRSCRSTATTTIAVYSRFEDAGWPDVIDWPYIGDVNMGTREAVRSASTNLNRITFNTAGEGKIRWERALD